MESFEVGEKILCWDGPLIYEAKCLKLRENNGEVEYYVHYHRWSKYWDQWVGENRLLKYNEANLKKQKEIKEAWKILHPKTTKKTSQRSSKQPQQKSLKKMSSKKTPQESTKKTLQVVYKSILSKSVGGKTKKSDNVYPEPSTKSAPTVRFAPPEIKYISRLN